MKFIGTPEERKQFVKHSFKKLLTQHHQHFDTNAYCIRPDNKWGNCIDCAVQKGECCPCNSCPRREGFWTPSETDENKLVEVKCHEPCYLFERWKNFQMQ